ncbi:MAG: PKD domain-containing protein [Bacteroidota bacterium]
MRCLLSALILLFLGNVSVAQNADFSADVISGCFPLTVNFTDLSTGSGLNSWAWSFGNGNTSGLQNPGTVYANPGVYTVRLTVSNASQSDTETKASYIVVYGNPTVDFIYDKSSGCKPLTVRFTDQTSTASGAISSWFWVFGDGGSSTDQNPTHTFTAAGSKTVILKVQNEHGCEFTKIINSPIEVFGPVTDFSASNTTVCTVPSPINFTNLTTGDAPLSYQWNYGDGATSTGTNGSHIYTSTGAFTVSLTSRDVRGCEDSHSMVINTGNAGGLSFQPSATKVCIGQPISFTVFPNAPVLSSDWDFGNGITSTDPSPEIQFSAVGNYTITLTAMLGGNACASVFSKTIEVAEVAEPTFTFSTDCDFNTIFTGSNNRAFRVEWYILGALVSTAADFVYPFHSPGAATVTLIAYNNLGCNNQVERTITVVSKPTASFLPDLEQDCRIASLSGCAPFTLVLKNTSSSPTAFTSHWDFGDGGASSQQDPVHTYQAKGTYTLTLTVTNAAGCIDITTATVTVADVKPTASFTRDKTTVCAKEIVNFTDQSLNANFWCWDFGDGTFGTGKTIAHGYSRPGTYTVKLTAKNAGCTDSFQIVNAVQVKDPYVDFAIQKNCPDPYRIDLVNLSTNYNSLRWDFGDGTVVNSDVPSHRYAATGSYDIKLSGTNTATACTVDAELTVQIQDIKADFTTNNPTPCKGSPVGFTDQSLFASQWLWDFGNGLSSSAKDPVTKYTSAGSFGIKLTVADSDGCTDDLTLPVTVLDIEGNFDFTASSTCTDLTVKFSDRSLATPSITSWSWDFGDGNSSTLQNPTNVYHTIKNYPVSLTVTGPQGTCAYIRDNAVKFTNPAPDFLIFKPEYCIDEKCIHRQTGRQMLNRTSGIWTLERDHRKCMHSHPTRLREIFRYPVCY